MRDFARFSAMCSRLGANLLTMSAARLSPASASTRRDCSRMKMMTARMLSPRPPVTGRIDVDGAQAIGFGSGGIGWRRDHDGVLPALPRTPRPRDGVAI